MPHDIPTLETRRLLLRPLESEDISQVQAIFPQWEIVKYLNARIPWPFPADGAETSFREVALPARERGEEWLWSIRLKSQPERIIGAISLEKTENENRGFWLVPGMRGHGYMMEACDTVTDFWFDVMKFPVLRAPKAVVNVASRRISERQGMRIVETKDGDYVCGRLPAEIWEITAEEWRNRKTRKCPAGTSRE